MVQAVLEQKMSEIDADLERITAQSGPDFAASVRELLACIEPEPPKRVKVPKLPIAYTESPDFDVRQDPGTLGAHTDEILAELGYAPAEIEALKTEKVVRRSDRMLNIDDAPAD